MTETVDAQTERHALHMLLDRSFNAFAMHILVAGLLAAYMASSVPVWRPIAFFVGLSIGLVLQFRLSRTYAPETANTHQFLQVRRQFDVLALWVGCMWGFAGFFLFPPDDTARQVFLTFVMGGMSLSAVGTQGMRLRTCYSSIIPGMAPLGLAYASLGSVQGFMSGGLIYAYLFVLIMLARKINAFMLQAFRLQVEKDGLLSELQTQATALEEARGAAEEANQAKSRFLAQASHDLRQPLHAISLFVESLPDAETDKERNAILGRTRQSLDVLSQLFDSLLDVTLLDTGGIEVRKRVFRLSDLIEEVVRDFQQIAEGCNVDLRSVPTRLCVDSDPVLVRRMLQNLVSNAVRHSEGERVLIGCRRRGDTVSIHVVDTGRGISPTNQDRIFGEFTRLDANRMGEDATPGLGLGLSIVKRVSEELGLSIGLKSQLGKGSDFSIQGLVRSENVLEPPEPRHALHTLEAKASVFVLDDDVETLVATELLLRRWGYDVEVASDPSALLTAAPDVIICDYELSPNLTGLNVLDDYADVQGQFPTAIMISGHTSKDLRLSTRQRGIPLLHKPLRPVQLRSALLNALAASKESIAGGE
ncbi:MAG: hybrid sensor histidine kinase/response regulator [Pseudomonadota bacterium]